VLLRKRVKLSSIDEIIDSLSEKTIELKDKAEAFSRKITEDKKTLEIVNNIRNI
jgi:hypothetical protein